MLREQRSSSRYFHLFFVSQIFHWALMDTSGVGPVERRHPRKREGENQDTRLGTNSGDTG